MFQVDSDDFLDVPMKLCRFQKRFEAYRLGSLQGDSGTPLIAGYRDILIGLRGFQWHFNGMTEVLEAFQWISMERVFMKLSQQELYFKEVINPPGISGDPEKHS